MKGDTYYCPILGCAKRASEQQRFCQYHFSLIPDVYILLDACLRENDPERWRRLFEYANQLVNLKERADAACGRGVRRDVAQARQAIRRQEMTELRKGQRIWVEATVDGPADEDGLVPVWVGSGPQYAASVKPADIRPTYLARREAMVRAIIANEELSDSLAQGAMRQGDSAKMGIVGGADEMLRAIDETPVPEWAGGEHE